MPISLYMDHNVPRAISSGLQLRGVDVLTAFDDNGHELDDSTLLDRATELGRVLFTFDDDLLVEAAERQAKGIAFAGVIYAHQLRSSIGSSVDNLEMIAQAGEPEDLVNGVQFLPL